jgi:competence protein ComEA
MTRFSFEPVKNWFGYTRRERRSSFILLLLIVVIAAIRFAIPEMNTSIEMIRLEQQGPDVATLQAKNEVKIETAAKEKRIVRFKSRLIEINTCDSAQLESLPGIGPVLSARIIKYRNLLGGYYSVSQLREVYGLSPEAFDIISSRITADSSLVKKIDINKGGYKQLIRLPYFDKAEVAAILKHRDMAGRITGFNELLENKLISSEKVGKVRPYLRFD